jgi:hypothetical protein
MRGTWRGVAFKGSSQPWPILPAPLLHPRQALEYYCGKSRVTDVMFGLNFVIQTAKNLHVSPLPTVWLFFYCDAVPLLY